jgi:hypothetical protein
VQRLGEAGWKDKAHGFDFAGKLGEDVSQSFAVDKAHPTDGFGESALTVV